MNEIFTKLLIYFTAFIIAYLLVLWVIRQVNKQAPEINEKHKLSEKDKLERLKNFGVDVS